MDQLLDGAQLKTDEIFELSAPYDNEHQGRARRVVFCCTAGLLRSPTAAHLAATHFGMNTRSAGVHERALQRLSVNLIEWAYQIVFVNSDNYETALQTFSNSDSEWQLRRKAIVWNLKDVHDYMAPALTKELMPLLEQLNSMPRYCRMPT
ncbi:hypothetical protein ACOTHJ_15110 [Achromobacter xylosoxidans]